MEDSFEFRVLDKSLLKSPIMPSDKPDTAGTAGETGLNFESFHGRTLQHPIGKVPFRRLLAWHYAMSVQHARWRMWITDADVKSKPPFTSSENLLTRSPTSLWPSTELLTLVGHACDVSEKDGDDSGDEEGS